MLIGATLLVYVADIKIRAMKGDFTPPAYNAYVVLTGSMVPEIMPNDVVITKRREPSELKVNDIVTFLSSDSSFPPSFSIMPFIEHALNIKVDEIIISFNL